MPELKSLHQNYPNRFPHAWSPGFEGDRGELLDGMLISMKFVDHAMALFYPESPALGLEDPDPSNFAFYTCVCFQWNLFETFVRSNLFALLADGLVDPAHADDLRSIKNQTEKLLLFIRNGKAFGRNPFTGELPSVYEPGEKVQLDYKDLNAIRRLRNTFVHGLDSPEIIEASFDRKEKEFMRINNTLLYFAAEIESDIRKLRNPLAPSMGRGLRIPPSL